MARISHISVTSTVMSTCDSDFMCFAMSFESEALYMPPRNNDGDNNDNTTTQQQCNNNNDAAAADDDDNKT